MEKNTEGLSLLQGNGAQEASSDKQWLVLLLAWPGLREMWELWWDASAVARVRANFLQPEGGGKDRRGTKFSWSVAMQQTPHLSSSSIHWAASC